MDPSKLILKHAHWINNERGLRGIQVPMFDGT